MKLISVAMATALACSSTFALGQSAGAPSGRGSTTGDPAASSATPGSSPTTGSSMKPSPSGSGTSTLGGKDDNGDQGRDKMPVAAKAPTTTCPAKMCEEDRWTGARYSCGTSEQGPRALLPVRC